MPFVRSDKKAIVCRYSVRYECDCNARDRSPLAFVDVTIEDHKSVSGLAQYALGDFRNGEVKFCPGCGTPIPSADAILAKEELEHGS